MNDVLRHSTKDKRQYAMAASDAYLKLAPRISSPWFLLRSVMLRSIKLLIPFDYLQRLCDVIDKMFVSLQQSFSRLGINKTSFASALGLSKTFVSLQQSFSRLGIIKTSFASALGLSKTFYSYWIALIAKELRNSYNTQNLRCFEDVVSRHIQVVDDKCHRDDERNCLDALHVRGKLKQNPHHGS